MAHDSQLMLQRQPISTHFHRLQERHVSYPKECFGGRLSEAPKPWRRAETMASYHTSQSLSRRLSWSAATFTKVTGDSHKRLRSILQVRWNPLQLFSPAKELSNKTNTFSSPSFSDPTRLLTQLNPVLFLFLISKEGV